MAVRTSLICLIKDSRYDAPTGTSFELTLPSAGLARALLVPGQDFPYRRCLDLEATGFNYNRVENGSRGRAWDSASSIPFRLQLLL